MVQTWITSDPHFNDEEIIGPDGYRTFDSIEKMNEVLINNINYYAEPNDTLWILGDFAKGDKKEIPALRERINCRNIHLLYGNHDKAIRKNEKYQKLFTSVGYYDELKVNGILVTMGHYPLGAWRKMNGGSINLYGHCHGTYTSIDRQHDVGMDNNGLELLDIEVLVDWLITKEKIHG